ncbi:hypothetical protein ACOSZF_19240 [Cytobacillus firmus]|uniref:hypothetical protein n=1 Tax=Cytobacillus firmus TaxID=1399 RepID=UPI003B9EE153
MNRENKVAMETKSRKKSKVGRSIGLYNDVMVGIEDSSARNEQENIQQNNRKLQSDLYPTGESILNSNCLRINKEKKYYYVRVKTGENTL